MPLSSSFPLFRQVFHLSVSVVPSMPIICGPKHAHHLYPWSQAGPSSVSVVPSMPIFPAVRPGWRIAFKVVGPHSRLMLPVSVSSAFLAHLYNPLLLLGWWFWLLLFMPALPTARWTHSWALPCRRLSWSWAWCFIALASWLPAAWNNCVWGGLMLLFSFCHGCLSIPSYVK